MTTDLHRHPVEGGYLEHSHGFTGPDQPITARELLDFDIENHRHLIVLADRNYVHEYSGTAEWTPQEATAH